MLPRRALAVVLARDDEAAPRFLRPFRERRVDAFEHVLRDRGDVRPQGEELRPRGHDVVRRDVVAEADQHLALDRVFWRRGDRKWRDVRPADDLDGSAVSRGPLEARGVERIFRGLLDGREFARLPGVGDHTANSGGRGGLGAAEIYEVVRGP